MGMQRMFRRYNSKNKQTIEIEIQFSLPSVMILLGGFGSRLNGVLNDRPKALAETDGRPFLDIQLQWLVKQGVKEVILLAGHMSSQIISYIGNGSAWELNIQIVEKIKPLGTGGAVQNALNELQTNKEFLLLNGDSLTEISLVEFCSLQKDMTSAQFVVVHQSDARRFGTVKFDRDNNLIGFQEKVECSHRGWINAGIYYFPDNWFAGINLPVNPVSLEMDMIPSWLLEKRQIGVFPTQGKFFDIGTPESYSTFQQKKQFW
jgi:D-glycero-alpha-D-manno-heptose 1-phosphate guanylyltransferase